MLMKETISPIEARPLRWSHVPTRKIEVTVTVAEAPVSGANLEVSVVDSPDPVQRNQLLTYTITVRNNGPDTATGVTLTVTPPVQVESGPLTPSQGSCTRAGLTITCAIGTIVNGAAVTADIPMFPFTLGAVSLSATATATETDPDPSNNTTTQSTTVLPPS